MSASQANQPDANPWQDREQIVFWFSLFATALFVFIAVSSAGDGYDHPPLIRVGAPLVAIIGFLTFVVLGGRLIRKVGLLKIAAAVVCMALLPIAVMLILRTSRTPPNVHNGEAIVFVLYVALSEVTAAVFMLAALIRSVLRRN
jgi:drug/metabolite transporter (DMT)-like permease